MKYEYGGTELIKVNEINAYGAIYDIKVTETA